MPEVIYSGPDGRLEGRINTVEGRRSPVALILHPLPQFGGNMNNPIIYNLYQTFLKLKILFLKTFGKGYI